MSRHAAFPFGARFERAYLLGFSLIAACSAPARPPSSGERGAASSLAPATTPAARFVHALPQAGFWVTHDDRLDRVVLEGARLELAASGEILRSAWSDDPLARSDEIVGSIAVPAEQGGGFVHWTRNRLFRSATFTGPIELIRSGVDGVRGVRPGLSGVVVITGAGPRVLSAGNREVVAFSEPGVLDALAAGPDQAIQLDVFGRAAATFDGGRSWRDLSSTAGINVRSIGLDGARLAVDTGRGRFVVGPSGALAPVDASRRSAPTSPFELAWRGPRADRDDPPAGDRELSPLQSAVLAGAALGDGTAFGVADGVIARVDLANGKIVASSPIGGQGALACQPLRVDDEVLFACTGERGGGAFAYVLRSRGGALPVVERAFADAGSFIADDEGALGFLGSCGVVPTSPGLADGARGEAPPVSPSLCVRRAPAHPGGAAEWIERTVDVDPTRALAAWAPRRDGTATALVIATAPLPEPASAPRVAVERGVRVVRVDERIGAYGWRRPVDAHGREGSGGVVDKRFESHADGSIDAWLLPNDSDSTVALGVTLGADGIALPHALPPALGSMQVTGSFGVAISRRGELYETRDHGRSWRPAGVLPLPPSAAISGGCSALGCSLGPLVRLGWGDSDGLSVTVASEPPPLPDAAIALPRLVCRGAAAPEPVEPPRALPSVARQSITTPWGETIEIARERPVPEIARPSPLPTLSQATAVDPTRAVGPSPREKPTHALLFRSPLAPFAPARRLDVIAPEFAAQSRGGVTPILGADGGVALLFLGDPTELLVARDGITALVARPQRRYGYSENLGAGGVALGGARSLVLTERSQRLTLEEHGPTPAPPLAFGAPRDSLRRRSMTLGRRDDGTAGVLVFDGAASDTVGVAPIDPVGGGLLALAKLAPWSAVASAADPRCVAPDPTAYRALVILDPGAWLALDPRALPGVALAHEALAEIRWGRDRVCLVAIDAAVVDPRRSVDGRRALRLVIRWDAASASRARSAQALLNGALRAADFRQDLRCTLAPPEAPR